MAKKSAKLVTLPGVIFSVTKDHGAIGLMIDNLRSRNVSFMADTHVAACSCILHVVYFKDTTDNYNGSPEVANQLCDILSEDKRANSLRLWFEKIGPFKWSKDKKKLVLDKTRINEFRAIDETILAAKLAAGKTFWALDKPKEYKGFNLLETVVRAMTKADDKLDGEMDEKDVIDATLLSDLKAVIAKHTATKAAA